MAVRELDSPPSLAPLYARAALPSRHRSDVLPDVQVVVRDVRIDRAHLAAYDRVCGFNVSDTLPCTYLHVLAYRLHVELIADRRFPLAPAGLVHVRNHITQQRAITADESVTLRVRAEDLRPHRRGMQFDMVTSAAVGGEEVWTARSTYLRRGEGSDDAPDDAIDPPTGKTAVWDVPADTGRRYAAVSGDHNPIHLHRLAARMFGFPRAVVHGMWSKARCLAALHDRLGDRVDVEVRFVKPVLLPATVAFARADTAAGTSFALRAGGRDVVHLAGVVAS